ncbi:MAG: 4Fe-4S dicluster domain-containing protein [Oscillospiraceae bacterium]
MKKFIYFTPELCSACGACAMACIDQNDVSVKAGEMPFRRVFTLETDKVSYYSVSCMHCKDAPCVLACPVGCIKKDEETGYTLYDNTNCIGCHSCAMACPFGVPTFDLQGKMQKCDACYVRQEYGFTPACVKVCPTGALKCLTPEEYNLSRQKRLEENRAQLALRQEENLEDKK